MLSQLIHEARAQFRRPFFWICAFLYFAIAFGDAYQAGLAGDGFQWINGADAISTRSVILSLLGILAIAGLLGQATSRDRDQNTEELVLTTPASRVTLGLPCFLIGFLSAALIGACFVPGMILGSMMPGIAPETLGPHVPSHYLKGFTYYLLPNFYLVSILAFAVGSHFRSQAVTWLAATGLLVVWIVTRMLLGQDVLRHDLFPVYALLEPFGTSASAQFAMERTVAQNNANFVPFAGLLLWNRLLWCSLATLLLIHTLRTLPLQPAASRASGKAKRRSSRFPFFLPRFHLLLHLHWELLGLLRTPGLRLFLALAALSLWFTASSAATHQFSLPTTDLLVHNTGFYFDKILILVLVWSAASLFHRERQHNLVEVADALPTSTLTRFSAKTLALLLIILSFWALAVLVNLAFQAANNFHHYELPLHLTDSFLIKAPFYLFMGILALSLQALIRNRYLAMAAFLVIYLLPVLFDGLGIHHPLFRFGKSNFFWYSLMDGYGHFLTGHWWMITYWTLGSLLLWTVAAATLPRGTQPRKRIALFNQNLLSGKGPVILTILCFAFLGTGFAIWNQTAVQNQWPLLSNDAVKAEMEKAFSPDWRDRPQPRVVAIGYQLDLYPSERRFTLDGTYTLHNPFDQPISELLLLTEPHLQLTEVTFPGHQSQLLAQNPALQSQHWQITPSLPPGERLQMTFSTAWQPRPGFRARAQNDSVNEVGPTEVLGNGTSLLNLQLLPAVGYTDRVEHKPRWKRRKYDLPLDWTPPAGEFGRNQSHDTLHLDWVEHVDALITTAPDQLPLHAGKILSDTTLENGRRQIHYRIDHPSRGWSPILSARYTQKEYPTPENIVPLTFYYDPRYAFTLDAMAEHFTDVLEYYTSTYGPAPFDHARMAQQSLHFDGLGNRSGLSYSTEILLWKTDLKKSKGDDLAKFAAHLMGMSWFGDQLIPANIGGAKIIHAGLPYWSAGLYLHQQRTPARSRQLRLQEMRELFRKRRDLADEETPFVLEHKDSGILRTKGLILLTYLAELAGPEVITTAFRDFLDTYRYQPAPYPTADDFLTILEKHLPAEFHPQLDDIFRHITRWDLRAHSATTEQTSDGQWKTTVQIEARKFHTSGLGEETEVPLNTPLFLTLSKDKSPDTALLKTTISPDSGLTTHTFLTKEKPHTLHLDPDHLLPDPNPNNQSRPVE
ncbi:MAG: hypothetical protein AAGC74_04840 [Verrucomicrobiota bacterium]